jgi:Leucine-rich repeat (LRR) protein
MNLISINLHATKIKDISPLKGMQLEHLNIDETKVKSIKALEGMPLRELRMHGCPIRDFSPLKKCRDLETIEPGYIRYKLKNMR